LQKYFLKLRGNEKLVTTYSTHETVLVGDVVGQLEFVEGYYFLHPLFARGRRVWMDVHSLGHFGVSLASHHPTTITRERKHGKFPNDYHRQVTQIKSFFSITALH
jgi:hypothetical protein